MMLTGRRERESRMKKLQITEIVKSLRERYGQIAKHGNAGCGCAPSASCCGPSSEPQGTSSSQIGYSAEDVEKECLSSETKKEQTFGNVLNVDLLVIDLSTCKRCVPTGDQLKTAVHLLAPVAEVLGIDLRHHEIVVQTPAEAKVHALLSSPTIRLNGRDIAQDIRESECESCGDLTTNNTSVDCREWHYRGKVYPAAPVPLLVEAIMGAMLNIDEIPPVVSAPLEELPENLQRYFDNKKQTEGSSCCT
jgi:hypothetical protein